MAGKKKEVENVSSLDSFRKMISGPNLSVVHFWSDWANQCGPMDEALKILVQESDLQEVI